MTKDNTSITNNIPPEPSPAEPSGESNKKSSLIKEISFERTKVLIAEDNPVIRKGLINFLTKWGYEPIEAETGDIAFQIVESSPDLRLAVFDWNLPGISGMQLCQRIRSRTCEHYMYIIMFSSRKSEEEQIMALDGGADDYLVKPSKPSILRARLGVGKRIVEFSGS
ncbi:MAG: response regulator [Proteobacteria bacterium]|nr:response regulator [Pseudomonadota bacterium]MBU1688061.1 response regulator [Pseudomonadota bacterium]